MKILAIGDFHGKFSKKLYNRIKKEDVDFILCVGDLPESEKIRKIIFKYWIRKKWWEVIGLKKAKQLQKESFDSGLDILKRLNSIGKKIYLIWGNSDFYKDFSTSNPKSINPGFYDNKIKRFKNILLINKKKKRIGGLDIIGHGGYVDVTEFIRNPINKDKKKQKRILKRYNKDSKELNKLFLDKKPEKNFIFLIHYTPYRIFDKVKLKSSPMYGKHVGWMPYNKIIKKYGPQIVICGHMHEYQGMKKLYGVPIINPGAAHEGKAAIIELDKGKIKKIKFIK